MLKNRTMKKKMITMALSLILLSGCGASKSTPDTCCEEKVLVTQREADEKLLNGLLFALITYAIFSIVK
jgi:uncharacterized lipoprotein YajG